MDEFVVTLEFGYGEFSKAEYVKIRMRSNLAGLNYNRFDVQILQYCKYCNKSLVGDKTGKKFYCFECKRETSLEVKD